MHLRVLGGFLALFLAVPLLGVGAPTMALTPEKSSGLYQVNEPIIWDVKVLDDPGNTITTAAYELRQDGLKVVGKGTLTFQNGMATIQTSLGVPGTMLAVVTTPGLNGQKGIRALGGAAVAYDQIQRAVPRPADFDAYWKSKLDQLATIPPNPVLQKVPAANPAVDYWKVTLDNINGTHVQGQLARPAGNAKCPAMLIMQYAGVYPLPPGNVTGPASKGWLVLNIMAFDLPIDQPPAFYQDKAQHELKNYWTANPMDPEKSLFLPMLTGDLQAAHYLTSRPDWDGKTLVVTGMSQGGLQSLATAGLDPAVTAMMVVVPARCDDSAIVAGRNAGWPFYPPRYEDTPQAAALLKASSYFNGINFASLIKCPALVGEGLLDETAPPTSGFATFNLLQGPKELCVLPLSNHTGKDPWGKSTMQKAYFDRQQEWQAALVAGNPAPVRPLTMSAP